MVEPRLRMDTDDAALPPRQSNSLLDGEKTGAVLLFSGLFLALVGVTFTAMGGQYYQVNFTLLWVHMLGPILFSLGGTFMLTSIFRFKIISCWMCRQQEEEEAFAIPSSERPVVVSNINQPIMLQGTTTMLCIPPAYDFAAHEVHHGNELQPDVSVSRIHAALPLYDALLCVDNAAFTAEGSAGSNPRGNR